MERPTGDPDAEDDGDDVLAQWPEYRMARGMEFKRVVRAAAALQSLYDDSSVVRVYVRQYRSASVELFSIE